MYFSRSLDELHPRVAKKARALIEQASESDIELVVVCTYRDLESEVALHDSGRGKNGKKMIYYWPKTSYHPWRMAFDVMPLLQGIPVTQAKYPNEKRIWEKLGEIGEALGLEWGGRWPVPRTERGHFQLTEGLTIAQLQGGKTL